MNLAYEFCKAEGKSVAEVREEYDGCCIDFAGDLLDWIEKQKGITARLAYFNETASGPWKYHAAAEVDGVVHDLWHTRPMKTEDMADLLEASYVDYPAEETTE